MMTRRYTVYDPDPSPFPWAIIIALMLITGGIVAWTNPNFFNGLLIMLNPEYQKLAEEQQRTQKEFYRMIIALCILFGVIFLVAFLWSRKKEKRVSYRIGEE